MRSFLYAIAIGLVGAALLHIVIILSLPSFTGRDAYTRVQAFGEANRFFPLASEGNTLAPINDDPAPKTQAKQPDTNAIYAARRAAQTGVKA